MTQKNIQDIIDYIYKEAKGAEREADLRKVSLLKFDFISTLRDCMRTCSLEKSMERETKLKIRFEQDGRYYKLESPDKIDTWDKEKILTYWNDAKHELE